LDRKAAIQIRSRQLSAYSNAGDKDQRGTDKVGAEGVIEN